MKQRRQSVILDAVRSGPIRSQEQLRRRVRAAGFDVTQATLSRDIRELGLVKGGADGAYLSPDDTPGLNGQGRGHGPASTAKQPALQRALAGQMLRIDRVQQLVLVRTGLGQAQSLCVAIDGARLPDIVGTLAGEDTILIIAPDARRARTLVKRLEEMANPQ
jgi:transcriptional regulator of arginine metabolism